MLTFGAKLRWKDGNILHPAEYWQSPSKRRLPRLMIEQRAMEVGLLVFIEGKWIVFKETDQTPEQIPIKGSKQLKVYKNRYQLLPEKIADEDTYRWLLQPSHALLLWGRNGTYFVKAVT